MHIVQRLLDRDDAVRGPLVGPLETELFADLMDPLPRDVVLLHQLPEPRTVFDVDNELPTIYTPRSGAQPLSLRDFVLLQYPVEIQVRNVTMKRRGRLVAEVPLDDGPLTLFAPHFAPSASFPPLLDAELIEKLLEAIPRDILQQ
ncbi:MAG: hypothetical protein Q8K86_10670 [Candidatus Nanopelagicaceae bacterium]|nr:hypothetical protein [Candidatus Nanopelagicaceae bacterium]